MAFALLYRRWRVRILAVSDRVIHGGGGGLGISLEGIQDCIMLRNRDLKESQEASMFEDRSVSQGVERRRSFILAMSAFW